MKKFLILISTSLVWGANAQTNVIANTELLPGSGISTKHIRTSFAILRLSEQSNTFVFKVPIFSE